MKGDIAFAYSYTLCTWNHAVYILTFDSLNSVLIVWFIFLQVIVDFSFSLLYSSV